jgi:hypothetical protein
MLRGSATRDEKTAESYQADVFAPSLLTRAWHFDFDDNS